jgi:hypothetical protein
VNAVDRDESLVGKAQIINKVFAEVRSF